MSYLENKVVNALVILIIVLAIILLLVSFLKYQPYILVYGEVKDDIVYIYLTDDEISMLNSKLKYNDETLNYQVLNISKEYFVIEGKVKREVEIDFEKDNNKYVLELYMEIGEETNLWNYLYKKYMKGVL